MSKRPARLTYCVLEQRWSVTVGTVPRNSPSLEMLRSTYGVLRTSSSPECALGESQGHGPRPAQTKQFLAPSVYSIQIGGTSVSTHNFGYHLLSLHQARPSSIFVLPCDKLGLPSIQRRLHRHLATSPQSLATALLRHHAHG